MSGPTGAQNFRPLLNLKLHQDFSGMTKIFDALSRLFLKNLMMCIQDGEQWKEGTAFVVDSCKSF
jgi:hypothetical protein